MSRSSVGALVAFNAKACEEAVHPKCVCHCGGRLHGKKHSRKWIRATVVKLELERLGASQCEIELEER